MIKKFIFLVLILFLFPLVSSAVKMIGEKEEEIPKPQKHKTSTQVSSFSAEDEDFQNPTCWKNNPKIPLFLSTAPILSIEPLERYLASQEKTTLFTSEVFVVTLQGDKKAIFKPKQDSEMVHCFAEVFAFEASQHFPLAFVPPVVIRKIKGRKGSFQLLVDNTISYSTGKDFTKALLKCNPSEVDNTKLFNYVIGQWDTSLENFLLKSYRGRLYLISIDFEGIFTPLIWKYGELPFVHLKFNNLPSPKFCKIEEFPFTRAFHCNSLQTLEQNINLNLFTSVQWRISYLLSKLKTSSHHLKLCAHNNNLWRQYDYNPQVEIKSNSLVDLTFRIVPSYILSPSNKLKQYVTNMPFEDLLACPALMCCKKEVSHLYILGVQNRIEQVKTAWKLGPVASVQ